MAVALPISRLPLERQIMPLKLSPPPLRAGVLMRAELQALLAEVRVQPATLVVAPAGFGKTTVMAQWAQDLSRTGAALCWLSLDSGDRDPGLFLAYLIRTFQQVVPGIGQDAWRALNSAANLQRDWPLVAGALCGDLQRQLAGATFLFFDDLHLVVDSAVIAQILGYVLRAAPPTLHVVMATRRVPVFAPLSRMRAEGLLLELSQRDLHLSSDETRQLLAAQGVQLADQELKQLLEHTEGWPLSLQLAARALANQPPNRRASFLSNLSGQAALIDYLAVEVLSELPAELIEFLRFAAIPSYFDSTLLEQVLVREDAPYLLQRAQGLGLPITQVGDQVTWLRFHPIWRELLQRGLEELADPETLAALHRRFGRAFEQRGDLRAALDHYANAGAEEELVRALREHAWPLLQSPQREMVRRWLELLPQNLRNSNPELLYMWGYSQIVSDPENAATIIERAAEQFRADGLYERELRALSDLAALLLLEMRTARFAAVTMHAVRAAKQVKNPWSRGAALVCVIAMSAAKGRDLAALRVAHHAAAYPLSPAWHWLLAMSTATIQLRLGRPDEAIAQIDRALQISQIDEDDRLRQNLLRLRTQARFDQGHHTEAVAAALDVHQHLLNYHRSGVVALSAQQIALMLIIQGRLDEAATFISQARAAFHERGELASLASLQAIELYSSLARGQAARTISAVGTSLRRLNEADTVAPDLRLRLLLAIVLGEGGEPKPAFTLASDLADRMAERGYRIFLASAELYAAHLASKLGNQAVREQRVRSGWEIAEDERLEHLPLIPAQALSDVAEEAFRRRLTPATVERVLRRQIPDETREMLTRLLGDSSADVRARAATLVGELGISSAYTSLRALAKDRSAEVRQASENALARLVYRPPYRLHVKTLGGFSITRGDQEVRDRDWRSSKARQLFQVLLTEHGRALPRDQVIELLWPDMDPEPAANNLRVTINRLSKALEPDRPEGVPPTYVIQYSETYTLNMESDIEVDSHLFSAASEEGQQAAQRGQRQVAITSLRRAVELYSGTYLPDCIYESWSEVERERLSMLFNETALLLASLLLEDGQTHEAIGLAWRVLEFDRLNEEAYLLLMRAHATLGERSAALRLYERCAAVLREELDVEPLPETTAFYNQLRDVHS